MDRLTRLEQLVEAEKDAHNWEKIKTQCVATDDGKLVRGVVSQVKCRGCGRLRWNDGTACRQLNAKGKPCAHRVVEDQNQSEYYREG